MSCFMCHVSHVKCLFLLDFLVELVGGGLLSRGLPPFIVGHIYIIIKKKHNLSYSYTTTLFRTIDHDGNGYLDLKVPLSLPYQLSTHSTICVFSSIKFHHTSYFFLDNYLCPYSFHIILYVVSFLSPSKPWSILIYM